MRVSYDTFSVTMTPLFLRLMSVCVGGGGGGGDLLCRGVKKGHRGEGDVEALHVES